MVHIWITFCSLKSLKKKSSGHFFVGIRGQNKTPQQLHMRLWFLPAKHTVCNIYVNNSWTYKKIKNCCSWSTKFSAHIVPSVCTHSKMMTPHLTKHKRHGVIFNFIFFKLNCWHKLRQNKRQNTSSGRTVRISRRIGSLSTVVPNL